MREKERKTHKREERCLFFLLRKQTNLATKPQRSPSLSPASPLSTLNNPVKVVHGVHIARRVRSQPRPHYPRGHPHGDAVRRQVGDDDRPGADLRSGAHGHGPEHAHPRPQERPVADVRVPRAPARPRSSERHVVQQRDAVADDRRLADDDARRVVDHHPSADPRPRVDVDVKDLADAGLDRQGQGAAACVKKREENGGGEKGGEKKNKVSFFPPPSE